MSPAWSANLVISVDQAEVIPGDSIALELRFEDITAVPNLDSLKIDGFQIVNRSSSTSVSIMNGRRSNSVTVTLTLLAQKEGVFSIGPYQLEANGKAVRSNSVEIKVTRTPSSKGPANRIFAKASLSQPSAVSGEQLFYQLKIYRPARNFGFSKLNFSLPEFQDLIDEQKQSTQKESQEIIDGTLYVVTEIQVPIFAVRSGLIQIPPASISYILRSSGTSRDIFDFFGDDFFSRRGQKKTSYSNSVDLRVGPLPVQKPELFSGLVGEFEFEAEVDRTNLRNGENLTLTLKCTGIGSLQDWQGPQIEIEGFKVYPDGDGVLEKKRTQEGLIGGIKTFKYALVAQAEGENRLGPFQLIYFQPKSKTFRTVSTKEFSIKVGPAENQYSVAADGGGSVVLKKKVEVLSKDILPIELDWDKDRPLGENKSIWIGCILVIFCFVILLEMRNRKRSADLQNPREVAYKQALVLFRKEVEACDVIVSEVVKKFLLRKLKIGVREITPQELCVLLQRAEISKDLVDRVQRLLEQEEMNRFTGVEGSFPDKKAWLEMVREYDRVL